MRVDLHFSIARTFSQLSSWLWQMQTIVSYQQTLEPTVRGAILTCFISDIGRKTGEQLTENSRHQSSAQ